MGTCCGLRSMTSMVVAGAIVACGAASPAADLVVGSPAPAIDVEHWFEAAPGADPIRRFDAGKVYVVEFWATWCPPCRASIPHLAELQERYADKGVTVIGVSDEDVETIEEFLKQEAEDATYGAITKKYRLATDPDGSVNADYMEASGQDGIPTAFIVGKKGEIEWIGHPMEIDKPLAQVVDGTWDRAAHVAAMREMEAIQAGLGEVSRLFGAGKVAAAVDRLDEMLAGLKDGEAKARLATIRTQLVIRAGGPRAVEAFTTALAAAGDSVEQLNELAWAVVELDASGGGPPPALVAAALGAARKAAALEPEEAPVLDTLAHLQAMTGDLQAAIATQRKAAAHAGENAEEINAYLEELEKRAAGR